MFLRNKFTLSSKTLCLLIQTLSRVSARTFFISFDDRSLTRQSSAESLVLRFTYFLITEYTVRKIPETE